MRTSSKFAIITTALAGAVASAAVAAPAANARATTSAAWYAYHGLSLSKTLAKSNQLTKQGYRPITVNVSGGQRYAAVWLKGGSPRNWGFLVGMSASGYQKRFDAALKQGGQPVSVSATGPAGSPEFAAVFEKKSGAFLTKSGLTPARFGEINRQQAAKGFALSSVDAYGTPGDIRYVGVWTPNPGGTWYYTYGKTQQQHEKEFYAKKAKGFRPVKVAVAPDGTYSAVWRKDGVKNWAQYVGMSASGFQKRFNDLKAKGLRPVQVNAENGVYAAIWQ
ncbi:hypothetical protein ABGB18_07950 [Nonomuraea sp. B12E4]|uniref:hypothetical protein n=1 Tax=Nonomuraea sp. B12E4 TaxID=3153564 RepID=UPI00325D4779